MSAIFRVSLVEDKFSIIRRLQKEGQLSVLNEYVKSGTEDIANYAKERFAAVLSKGHKFRVAASGRAANNLEVKLARSQYGRVEWQVIEGTKTYANFKIREGINPGEAPKLSVLKSWAKAKGLSFTSYYEEQRGLVKAHTRLSSKGKVVNVRGYIRRLAGEAKRKKDDPFYRIRSALFQHGTQRGPRPDIGVMGAHWMGLPPVGAGKFDYVSFVVRQHGTFKFQVSKLAVDATTVYVDYLATGRKRKGSRTFNLL